MESGVKNGNLGNTGHNSLASADTHQVCGVVQGAQRNALLDSGDNLIIDDAGIKELHAAMQDAVADSIDLVGRRNNTINRINQNIKNGSNCFGVSGHGDVLHNLTAMGLMVQTAINIDTLAQAISGNCTGLGIHQSILQAGRAGIDNQNIHWGMPPNNKYIFFFGKTWYNGFHKSKSYPHTHILYFIFPFFASLRRNFLKKGENYLKTIGVVCEYNPFHLGHAYQLQRIREYYGNDCAIVCVMSGQFVQRGAPAVFDKSLRAGAAVSAGADLVLELPVEQALSSAEAFAYGGVKILSHLCDALCFGTETADASLLQKAAEAFSCPQFKEHLHYALASGVSFPAARQEALEALGFPALSSPNDLLALEYAKAISALQKPMELFPIHREGSYHSIVPDDRFPSATAIRASILHHDAWQNYIPQPAVPWFCNASVHSLEAGEKIILAKLRTMTDAEFEMLPFGSEGLWRKLMHESRDKNTLEEILSSVKSKRYTRSRLNRMVLCALLGITDTTIGAEAPYIRVLAFNDTGRKLLSAHKKSVHFCNPGEPGEGQSWETEMRAGDLYGLFAIAGTEPPGAEDKRRIVYIR